MTKTFIASFGFFIVLVLSLVSQAQEDTGVTPEEARFARIYQKFNSKELGDEKWTEIAGDKVSETYILQTGDNLWDISIKLFGNGYYWPKVWQLNEDITNPHLVETGRTMRFTPGTATTPPTLGVDVNIDQKITESTTVDDNSPPDYDTIVTQDMPEGNQVVIPPGKKSRPVLNHIPASFPDRMIVGGNYDRKTGFALDGLKRVMPKITAGAVPTIVVDKVWEPDGKIIEMEGGSGVAATYQSVIFRLSGPAKPGDHFTAYSTNGKVTDPSTGYTIGTELETRTEIEVEGAVQGSAQNTYRGFVVFAALPCRIGDSLKAGNQIVRANYETDGPLSAVAARVINGENNKRNVFGLHNIVYLDKGSEDGLQTGHILNVLKNIEARNPDSVLKLDDRPIGLLKVVEVEPHVSTAIIVSERDAIVPGDMTMLVAEDASESPKSDDDLEPEDKAIEGE